MVSAKGACGNEVDHNNWFVRPGNHHNRREKESQKRVEQMRKIRETDRFIEALKFYELTSQQRKTLRGQAIAGDLEGAQKGLQTILDRRENNG